MNQISDSVLQYKTRLKRRKNFYYYAKSTSHQEILFNFQKIIKAQKKGDLLKPFITLTNSSIWVSRAGLSYFKAYFDLSRSENDNHKNPRSSEILSAVANGRTIEATDAEVFHTIYSEISYAHLHEGYKTPLKIKRPDVTIVLISGVFNEVFSTPAFKRGAEKLFDEYHIKHIAPTVSGRDGSIENAKSIKKQIEHFLKIHPEEKLWFFCFSKGGIDTLHFLKNEGKDLSKNILGISFIATPIMGSDHLNHNILKLANTATKAPQFILKKILGKKPKLIMENLQTSLSRPYRESWFKRNHKELPKNVFYTALALESKWSDAHVYMMVTKAIFRSKKSNDGVVDVENAQFPNYFKGMNLGILEGHHLIGLRSSLFDQEALMKAHLLFLNYKKML